MAHELLLTAGRRRHVYALMLVIRLLGEAKPVGIFSCFRSLGGAYAREVVDEIILMERSRPSTARWSSRDRTAADYATSWRGATGNYASLKDLEGNPTAHPQWRLSERPYAESA